MTPGDRGADDTRIERILERWFERTHAGDELDVEELCADAPHLVPRIRELLQFQAALLEPRPAAPDRAPLPVDRIGHFELKSRLAAGGMGEVYLAQDLKLQRIVALKILRPEFAGDPTRRLRFRREAKITAALEHPNIVPIYETGEADGCVFLAMKRLTGDTLDHQNLPWSPETVARVGAQVARALHAAHEVGIVHRDIKPSNILIDGDFPYVLDFGLARALVDLTLTREGHVPGTLAYMPPEQLRGGPGALSPRVDVYSLGATLYQCATGHLPFLDEESEALVRRILTQDPPPLGLPAEARGLEIIVLRALEKNPNRRFASALAMAEDLERYADGQSIQSRPPSVASRVARLVARHRGPAAAIATALVAAFVLAIQQQRTKNEHDERLNRQLDEIELELLNVRPAAAVLRLRSLAHADPELSRRHARFVLVEQRASLLLLRERLLDDLQTERYYRDVGRLRSLGEQLKNADPAVSEAEPTIIARLMLAFCAGDREVVDALLQDRTQLPGHPRFRAALGALLHDASPELALAELEAKDPGVRSTTPNDHVFAAAALQIAEATPTTIQREFEQALSMDPFHWRARLGSAFSQRTLGDTARAEEALRLMWREDELRPELNVTIARLATINGRFARARQHLKHAATALRRLGRPPFFRLVSAEVDLALATGDLDRHAELNGNARRRFGDSAWLAISRGYAANERRDRDAARRAFGDAARLARFGWNQRRAEFGLLWLDATHFLATERDAAAQEALRQRAEALLAAAEAAHDANQVGEIALILHALHDAAGRPGLAQKSLDLILPQPEPDAYPTSVFASAVLNQAWGQRRRNGLLALGDRAGLARRAAMALAERAFAEPDSVPVDWQLELAICACGLSLVVGDEESALRAGSIARHLQERGLTSPHNERLLDEARASLGLDAWPPLEDGR
ncbi:MAG: serine/threonine-protein kinase [Planctomycetota bacterium]